VVLLEAGYEVIVLCNSSPESLLRVARICGKAPLFIQGDIRGSPLLDSLYTSQKISAALYFVSFKV